ncbi:MAG: 50S ribosomal protein L24e [Candidatus Micrarchaeota archaeon]|nr:50S ribosomal protein L24e [Candidatus Micrarchaeota archaeon]MCX8154456.1 50S ribosomal protein L24e [Candidatus Micrarchaeota archaeon]
MKCSFCGREIALGRGIIYFTSNGKMYSFDSSKCRRNMLRLNRDPKDMKWSRS